MHVFISISTSIFAFFVSFFASSVLSVSEYGSVVSYFSVIYFAGYFFSFGASNFFANNIKIYSDAKKILFLVQVALFVVFSLLVGFFFGFIESYAFLLHAFMITFSLKKMLDGQMKADPVKVAFFQSVPTIIKSLCIFSMCVLNIYENSTINGNQVIASFSLAVIVLYIAFGGISTSAFEVKKVFNIIFFRKDLYYSWVSMIFSMGSVLLVPVAVNFFCGEINSSYYGIYMLYLTMSTTASTALIINKIFPEIAIAISEKKFEFARCAQKKSLNISLMLAIIISLGAVFSCFFLQKLIWNDYSDIFEYMVFASIVIFIKTMQGHYSMLCSFGGLIKYKAICQACYLFLICFLLWFIGDANIFIVIGCIFLCEIFALVFYMVAIQRLNWR